MREPHLLVWLGAAAGPLLLVGVWLVVRAAPVVPRARLEDRLVPYLSGSAALSSPRSHGSGRRYLARAARALGRVLGGDAALCRRLEQAGDRRDPESFRADQVLCAAAGVGLAAAVAGALIALRGTSVLVLVGLVVCGAVGGVWFRDHLLSRAIQRRRRRILLQFPTVAELIALSVGAGEGVHAALERAGRAATGDLGQELQLTLAQVRAGRPLVLALDGLGTRTGIAAVARFVDGVNVGVERGTPLAEVLRAQAEDSRQAGRHELIEIGGRKEILMLLPVVFGLLPVTVLFAVYPGVVALSLGGP